MAKPRIGLDFFILYPGCATCRGCNGRCTLESAPIPGAMALLVSLAPVAHLAIFPPRRSSRLMAPIAAWVERHLELYFEALGDIGELAPKAAAARILREVRVVRRPPAGADLIISPRALCFDGAESITTERVLEAMQRGWAVERS